jgi:inner membrane transporter RhtA
MTLSLSFLFTAMISIQIGASFAKNLFLELGPAGATSLRLFFGSVLLLVFWRPWREVIRSTQWKDLFLYGLSLGGMNLFFFFSLDRIPLGIAVALEFLGPLSVAIFHSKKKLDFVWATIALIGVILLMPVINEDQVLDLLGILYSLISGAFWGLYIIWGQQASKNLEPGPTAAWGMTFAALLVIPFTFFSLDFSKLNSSLLGTGFLVAILSSSIPYSLEMFALKKMPKKTFGILMSLEPAIGAIVGYLFLEEVLSLFQWLAIMLIIISSMGTALFSQVQE